jgi:hypothetical protein
MPEPASTPEADEAGLYEIVPEQFIAARDSLVRRLRAAGDKAGAARVAKRRRPPLTAWALNRVARDDPEIIDELLRAGGELRAAMGRALAGDASGLRQAHSHDRAAVEAVVAGAAARLTGGHYPVTEVMRTRMGATLRAAVVDESVAERLRASALETDYDAPGFGIDALWPLSAPEPEPPPGQPSAGGPEVDDLADGRRRRDRQHRMAGLAAEAARLESEAQERVAEADRLEGDAARLEGEARTARARALVARRAAEAATESASAARAEADQAASAAD